MGACHSRESHKVTESGIAIAIHSNGLKVLNRVGVARDLLSTASPPWQCWRESSSNGQYLGGPASTLLNQCTERYGWPCFGMSRSKLQLSLKKAVEDAGISYLEGWRLERIEEVEGSVIVVSSDGRSIQGCFVVGCDGSRSLVRDHILQQHRVPLEDPTFSGSVVIAATTKTPDEFKAEPGVYNHYGMT